MSSDIAVIRPVLHAACLALLTRPDNMHVRVHAVCLALLACPDDMHVRVHAVCLALLACPDNMHVRVNYYSVLFRVTLPAITMLTAIPSRSRNS